MVDSRSSGPSRVAPYSARFVRAFVNRHFRLLVAERFLQANSLSDAGFGREGAVSGRGGVSLPPAGTERAGWQDSQIPPPTIATRILRCGAIFALRIRSLASAEKKSRFSFRTAATRCTL